MKIIADYIKQSKAKRQSHLKLSEKCNEIGGNSTQFKGLLAYFLGTTIPHGSKDKVLLCHACNNGKCSNVNHLYWGTSKENINDKINYEKEIGVYKSAHQFCIEKYGYEAVHSHMVRIAKEFGYIGGQASKKVCQGIPKSPECKRKISESLRENHNRKGKFKVKN